MSRNFRSALIACGVVLIMSASVVAISALPNDTENERSAPPTTTDPPTRYEERGFDSREKLNQAKDDYAFAVWLQAQEQAAFVAWTEGVWQAELARQAAAQPSYGGTNYGGECGGGNWVIPEYIVQRESGCSYDAYNATGCDGQGCIGAYQLHAQHFNGGACSDLGTDPAGQDECAARLWNGGAGAGNWAATL